ncbi:DinB family protein [Salmonirosea aquatica]|uniref:DUF1572 domain-containing protein n=1 Tax=Salmonirosea aquatica TaxID=2654236 RepID=A0A7C9BFA9_9BACT|nr:DUF1572 domain-containing protein [Cytophagaceae bacterium SJW1-29]
MASTLASEFIEQSLHYFHLNTPRIIKCLDELSEEEVWQRPNGASNSVGNLILHLCGNIRQYIISGLGNQPDTRTRSVEFSVTEGFSKAELLQKLNETLHVADTVIRAADDENLLRERRVQAYTLTGLGIIIHVVEHYSYHTGQIAFWTKQLRNQDLGFYAGVNLNATN